MVGAVHSPNRLFLSLEKDGEIEKQMEYRRGMKERKKGEWGEFFLRKCKDYSPDSTVGSGSSSQVCSLLRRPPHTT